MSFYSKAIVAAGLALYNLSRQVFGLELGVDEAQLASLVDLAINVGGAVGVWAVPNRQPE